MSEILDRKNWKYLPNNRVNFSKISGSLPLPYLCEIQTDSFKWFCTTGVDEVFRDFFPILTNLWSFLMSLHPLVNQSMTILNARVQTRHIVLHCTLHCV